LTDNEAGCLLEFLVNGWQGNDDTGWRLSPAIGMSIRHFAATAMKGSEGKRRRNPAQRDTRSTGKGEEVSEKKKGHLSYLALTSISFV